MSTSSMRPFVRPDGCVDTDAVWKLVNGVTPGNWITYSASRVNGTRVMAVTALRSPCAHDGFWLADVRTESEHGETNRNNALFIAASRSLVPMLLVEVEQLRRDLAQLRTEKALAGFGGRPVF